ncbi:CidA/LrgA family protein, partial [Methylobacterium trifolii]
AQLLGEAGARAAGLPVPGPVIGMALMLGFLFLRDSGPRLLPRLLPKPLTDGTLEATGAGLLANLSLMFVPAGAGIVGRLDVVQAQGVRLAVVLVVSTAAALTATVLVFLAVSCVLERRTRDGESGGPA